MLVSRTVRGTFAALAILALAACGTAEPTDTPPSPTTGPESATVTVISSQGEVEVPLNPQRVVVFEHGILDTIDALGFGDAVVGIPHHVVPAHLSHYTESAANTGTLFEPDFEAINALDPDLIIVGGRSAATLADMQAIAPTVDLTYEWENVLDSVEANAVAIGTIFGAADQAAGEVAQLRAAIADTATALDGAGNALVIMTIGGDISAYGPGSRFGFVYEDFGLAAAADQVAIADHGDTISFEFIAEVNPDILIVLDRDTVVGEGAGSVAAQLLDNDLVNGTNAVQNDRVVYVTTEAWYLAFGGLNAMATIAADLDALR